MIWCGDLVIVGVLIRCGCSFSQVMIEYNSSLKYGNNVKRQTDFLS